MDNIGYGPSLNPILLLNSAFFAIAILIHLQHTIVALDAALLMRSIFRI